MQVVVRQLRFGNLLDRVDREVPMEIRQFRMSDEESVVALWTKVFGYPQPRNEPRRVIRTKLEVDDDLFFVAVREDVLIGTVLIGTVMGGYDGHRGWIYSLAVAPESRRQGVGSALMKHVERELQARHCLKINLQVVASNASIVAFYDQLGYAVEERISMGKVLEEE
jgi:ribosomal protein S18 acetylase RimI-like enzyme